MNPSKAKVRAQDMRRPTLVAAVGERALCASSQAPVTADDWFRGDEEPAAEWAARKRQLKALCNTCPVLAECRELALRDGEGHREDYMVRAGLTAHQLSNTRRREADRIEEARQADIADIPERRQLHTAARALRIAALSTPNYSRMMPVNNRRVRKAAAQYRAIVTARRARAGWGEVA